jgi:phenylalanyl-tRNA synthetase alpha chain
MENDLNRILESLSPNERKILPHLDAENPSEISKRANLEKISTLRSLEYLKNKKIIDIESTKEEIVELGTNGILSLKKGLPERRLLNLLAEKKIIGFQESQEKTGLSPDEFKAALGALKKKALIEIKNGKLSLNANPEEIAKKSLEEQFLEKIPIKKENLTPEQRFAFENLKGRKDIILLEEKKKIKITITELGRKIMNSQIKPGELIEAITPSILKSEKEWKGKKFRRYDIETPVPQLSGGKRHFVNQALDYTRRIWTDMGFQEMTGNIIQSSFWNFDALFTAQDHPVREMQDTFFLKERENLPDKRIVEKIKKAHESGVGGSKGWQYNWKSEEAEKNVLRTHTTCLSAQTLVNLSKDLKKNLPAKYFALGKCFRNETIDWSHGFEFNQTEGIVVDENANFRHLLGYLKQFFKKMGFEKIRFRPAYFPYTEPSLEIDVWHPEKKIWLELGGAGMFRPEVTIPLLGKHIPILAWGQGFDRIIMDSYQIKDLREMYKNDLTQLRKMKFWNK